MHKLWPKFGQRWISRFGSLRFWWFSVQRKALIPTICSRAIFTNKCRQQQNFNSDSKEAWHYNHVTFTPMVKHFVLYCRLIYMLSMLYVRLTIKLKVGIPERVKVGWYPHKIIGSSHLNTTQSNRNCFNPPWYFAIEKVLNGERPEKKEARGMAEGIIRIGRLKASANQGWW